MTTSVLHDRLEERSDAIPRALASRPVEGRLLRVRLPGVRRPVVDGGRGRLEGLAACAEGSALPGACQTRDLPLHERGTVARRYVRLQARALLGRRQGVCPAGPHPRREADGLALEIPEARRERAVGLRAVPRGRRARRRAVRHPRHANRPPGPSGSLSDAPHRQLAVHPALARGMDALRARDRERRPPRLHRDQADGTQRRRPELRECLPPGGLPGDPHRQRGSARRPGPDRQHQEPSTRQPSRSDFSSTSSRR